MTETFIKNELSIDNDALKGVITYTMYEYYDLKQVTPDGKEYWTVKSRVLEKLVLDWNEVEKRGHHNVTAKLRAKYNIEKNIN